MSRFVAWVAGQRTSTRTNNFEILGNLSDIPYPNPGQQVQMRIYSAKEGNSG
jgi:hypothetical protein